MEYKFRNPTLQYTYDIYYTGEWIYLSTEKNTLYDEK